MMRKRTKHLLFFILIINIIILCSCNHNNVDNKTLNHSDIIEEFLNVRYNNINIENIEEKYKEEEKYFTDDYKNRFNFINSDVRKQESIGYFNEYNFTTKILVSQINEVADKNNQYNITLSVLYESDDLCYTHYADYKLYIEIDKKKLKINNISGIEDTKRVFLEGMELHIHEDKVEAILIEDELEANHGHE